MLFVEKGGESQIEDELAAYNPLIPDVRHFNSAFKLWMSVSIGQQLEIHSVLRVP
jgi:hypothetical protein